VRRASILLISLFLLSCSQNQEEATSEKVSFINKGFQFNGIQFEKAILSPTYKFIAATGLQKGKAIYLIDVNSDDIIKIFEGEVTEFLFADEDIAFITKVYSPRLSYSLYYYCSSDSSLTCLADSIPKIKFLNYLDNKLLVKFNDYIRIFNKNLNDIEAEVPEGYFFFEGKELSYFDELNEEVKLPENDDIIWMDYKNGLIAYYLKTKGLFLGKKNSEMKLPGNISYPVISNDGRFLAGIKEDYSDQKLMNSELIIYDLSGNKIKEVINFNGIKSCSFSSNNKYILTVNNQGNIVINKFEGI